MRRALFPALLTVVACDPQPIDEGPVCTEPAAVACEDALFEELTLAELDPSPQDVQNEVRGDGFHSDVDARAGGLAADPRQSFLYLRFTDNGLEKVAVNDRDALGSMDWDIAFHRYVARLNGGSSGPSCVSATSTGQTSLDDVAEAPDSGYLTDQQFNDACEFIAELPNESRDPVNERDYENALGIGKTKSAWWSYEGCVETTGEVFVVRLADRRHVKLQITHFYNDDAQTECNETGLSTDAGAARIQIDWAFLGDES